MRANKIYEMEGVKINGRNITKTEGDNLHFVGAVLSSGNHTI